MAKTPDDVEAVLVEGEPVQAQGEVAAPDVVVEDVPVEDVKPAPVKPSAAVVFEAVAAADEWYNRDIEAVKREAARRLEAQA
jgi:hypothetical protein